MIDYEKLEEGLNKLTGYDMEEAELAERAARNNFVNLNFTKSFQARLAAKALDMNPHDLKELPIKEYNDVTNRVFAFLALPSETTP